MMMSSNPSTNPLHPATDVGTVTLKVADLDRSIEFYTEVVGLQVFNQTEKRATMGVGQHKILEIEDVPGATLQPSSTGLYHAAILLPTRHALAVKVAQLANVGWPFGYADHLVSEAFYLDDPDGNGLELYRDRPRSEWQWDGGTVRMASDPIDFESLMGELQPDDPALFDFAMPVGTKMGHIHLRVADIEAAEKFYHGVMGFDIVAHLPSASFVSAGGYHHHLGMNTWHSRGGKPAIEPGIGLREFSIILPTPAELERVANQIQAAGVKVEQNGESATLHDPFQNRIQLVLPTAITG